MHGSLVLLVIENVDILLVMDQFNGMEEKKLTWYYVVDFVFCMVGNIYMHCPSLFQYCHLHDLEIKNPM